MSYKQGGGWLIGLVLVALLGGIGHSAAGDGLSNTDSEIVVLGSKLPIPDFTFAPASPLDRLTVVQFIDRSRDPDGKIAAWRWDFGDGTAGCPPDCGSGTEQNPTHEYAGGGTYTVSLTVTDNSDLVNTISKEIIVGRLGIPILITGGIPEEWRLRTYSREFTVHFQRGDTIVLSANSDGTRDILVHIYLKIKVIHPNGTVAGKVINFCPQSTCQPQPPLDITSMLAVGKNKVSVTLFSPYPDLQPKPKLSVDKVQPKAGDKVNVYAEVANTGATPAGKFYVSFFYRKIGNEEKKEFDRVLVPGLAPEQQLEVQGVFDTSGLPGGAYEICVEADPPPDDFVEELDEKNNTYCSQLPLIITPVPDLQPKPELEFDPPPPVKVGDEVKVTAWVVNNSVSPSDKFYVAFLYSKLGDETMEEFDRVLLVDGLPGLEKEGKKVEGLFKTHNLDPGGYVICVHVDRDNFIEELDETNNRYCTSLPFEVTESGDKANLLPVSSEVKPSPVLGRNSPVLVSAAITIQGGGSGPYMSSSPLWLVRFTRTSAARIVKMMPREIAELQQEIAAPKSSWNTRVIARKLDLASRYAYYCALRPRLCQMAQILLNKAINHLDNIDFGKVIEWVKEGLPELSGEIEALIMLNEAVEEPAKETLKEIEELYKLLCSMDPSAADCGVTILDPIIWPWPEIAEQIKQIKIILRAAWWLLWPPVNLTEATQAMQLISEARGLLPLPLGEIEEHWGEIGGRLTQIKDKGRLLWLALRRGKRHSQEAQGFFFSELYPNPITSGLPVKVMVNDIDVESLELQVFALDGRLVLDRGEKGSYLQFSPLDEQGRPLANGVYLYVVTVKGYDGHVLRSEVRKLVILR